MVVSSDELERLADDIYKDRVITGSIYCGNCGYNLKTLPYMYTCPECGNEYNARPLDMCGIFSPHEIAIPFDDAAAMFVCALSTFVLGRGAINPFDVGRSCIAVIFAVFSVLFARKAYIRMRRFFKATAIARRIAADDED